MFEFNWSLVLWVLGAYVVAWLVAIAVIWKKGLLHDWKWGILPTRLDRVIGHRDSRTRLSPQLRLVVLNCLSSLGVTTINNLDEIGSITFSLNTITTGIASWAFLVMGGYWLWRMFFSEKDYGYKSTWSWIPLPMFRRKYSYWYLIVIMVFAAITILDLGYWFWVEYLADWHSNWSAWQIIAVVSWIVLAITGLMIRIYYRKDLNKYKLWNNSANAHLTTSQANEGKLSAEVAQLKAEKTALEEQAVQFRAEREKVVDLTREVAELTHNLNVAEGTTRADQREIEVLKSRLHECELGGRVVIQVAELMRRKRGEHPTLEILAGWRISLRDDAIPKFFPDKDKRARLIHDAMPEIEL
ncbi:MAG: hypothetical protein WA057_02065 [Candidatus Magasanikiibacteriota bacterium]